MCKCVMDEKLLKSKKVVELKQMAKDMKIEGYVSMRKAQLVEALSAMDEPEETEKMESPVAERPEKQEPADKADNLEQSEKPEEQ